jgi:hypothetical protein
VTIDLVYRLQLILRTWYRLQQLLLATILPLGALYLMHVCVREREIRKAPTQSISNPTGKNGQKIGCFCRPIFYVRQETVVRADHTQSCYNTILKSANPTLCLYYIYIVLSFCYSQFLCQAKKKKLNNLCLRLPVSLSCQHRQPQKGPQNSKT